MRQTLRRGIAHFSYTPLLGFAAAVSFMKLVAYAQLINVAEFGALGKMLLVSAVIGMAASIGLQSVVSRDLPALFAQGRERRGMWLLAQTIGVSAAVTALVMLAAAIGLRLFDLSAEELMLGATHGWAQLVFLTVAFESRSRLHMMRYSRDMALRNLAIALGGAAAGAAGFGGRGVVLAEVAGTLAFLVVIGPDAIARARVSWSWLARAVRPRAGRLPWRPALLMLAGGLVIFASFNLDRWTAAEVLARDEFGAYAFAWLCLLAAQSVQGLLNSGLFPLLSRRRAESQDPGAFRLTWLMSGTVFGGGLVLVVPAAWSLGWSVENWTPKYTQALPLLVPLLLAAVLRVSDFWSSYLLVIEREGTVLWGQMAAVIAAGSGYLLWMSVTGSSPTPVSLAWLALGAAALSHGASAATALVLRRRRNATA